MRGSYNPVLVAFSVVIALFTAYAALVLAARVNSARGRFRTAWLLSGSVAVGMGLWSMHFVAMLALRLPVPVSFDSRRWLLSLAIGTLVGGLLLSIASRRRVTAAGLVAAALLLGGGLVGMHYVGIAAMRVPGRVEHDPVLFGAGGAVAVATGLLMLRLCLRSREDDTARAAARRLGAALTIGFALAAMHFVAAAGMRFSLTSADIRIPSTDVLRTEGLAGGIAVGTLLMLGLTVLGALVDRRLRARSAETEAVRRSEARFRSLIAATAQVVWTADSTGVIVGPQPEWAAFTGTTLEQYRGWGWMNSVHADDRDRVETSWRDAVRQKRVLDLEYRLRRADGEWRHVAVRAVPVLEPDGRVREWVGATTDITDRKRASAAREFLVEASRVLASSLDYPTTLRTVARLAVPTLADWCAVDVVTVDGQLDRVAVEHVDPEKLELARQLQQRYPPPAESSQGVSRVVRTGTPELVPEISEEMLTAAARDPEHLRLVRALGLHSYLCVPLLARGKTLGALTLVLAESGGRYGPEDLAQAEELARRAAIAIDNARLYHETEEARAQLEQQAAELQEAQAEMEMAHDELQRAYEDLAARTREAERARHAADEANAAKSSFLATMSHELRTPLNAIAGYTQLLEMGIHGPVTDGQRETLDKIRRNQTHLLGLINDVLNFAKIEAGQVQYDLQDVPLDVTLAAVEALVEPQITARGLHYVYRGGDRTVTVVADQERMEQVVLNLLSNAIKFTDKGGLVELWWESDASRARIHVRDTGTGIPPDKLEMIFEPFVQVDTTLTRSAEGTGLGLAISRDLARAMNGDLAATSTPGEGSTFTLTLPLGRPRIGAKAADDAAA